MNINLAYGVFERPMRSFLGNFKKCEHLGVSVKKQVKENTQGMLWKFQTFIMIFNMINERSVYNVFQNID